MNILISTEFGELRSLAGSLQATEMKEIKQHTADGDLISIASLTNCYGDQRYLALLISSLLTLTSGQVHVWLSRPDYDYDIEKFVNLLKEAFPKIDLLIKPEYFEVSFVTTAKEIDEQVLAILSKLWFAFQHASFVFSASVNSPFDVKRRAWYEIVAEVRGFVVFKGAEDDVLWIGKSSDIQFDLNSLEIQKLT
jgi:hypothetical protein